MKIALLFIVKGVLPAGVLVASCFFFWYSFCAEASFDLADESRLPRWFTIPLGHTRADVSVTMSTYVVVCGGCSIYILRDHYGKILQLAYGKDSKSSSLNKFPKDFYPAYTVSTVNGISDVIENRKMEPKFYMSDNSAVLKELLDSQLISPPK